LRLAADRCAHFDEDDVGHVTDMLALSKLLPETLGKGVICISGQILY
jgi:hypothetical protein